MLNTWAAQRKLVYTAIGLGVAIVVIGIPAFFFLYTPPSCTDGKQNQDEAGVDCGGSCQKLCQAKELPPVIVWAQKFMVAKGVYSVAAYIENPNVIAEARGVPYTFTLLDDKGVPIVTREGTTYIPARKEFAVFESGLQTDEKIPSRIQFEFTGAPYWTRAKSDDPRLVISDKVLTNEEQKPRIDAVITNPNIDTIENINVVAIVYESNGNAIAASKTLVEVLEKDQSAPLVFTWPNPYPARLASCEVPVDIAMVIDRSGSMDDDGKTPPQPLTDVKNAAVSFVDRLKTDDQVSLVSFATTATEPIDSGLSNDFVKIKTLIRSIAIIEPGDSQYTNIAEGILKADAELQSARHKNGASKIIVLLTDGIASRPLKAGNEKYPEEHALTVAAAARDHGNEIYTIGLGNNLNSLFLEQIATAPEYFYAAPTTKSLTTIYRQIATAICKKGPTKIELLPVVESR